MTGPTLPGGGTAVTVSMALLDLMRASLQACQALRRRRVLSDGEYDAVYGAFSRFFYANMRHAQLVDFEGHEGQHLGPHLREQQSDDTPEAS